MTQQGRRRREPAGLTRTPVTLTDVADSAGVSLATASRVLNGSIRTVGPELRERVLLAARELGYTPNAHAQAIARGSSHVVGLIVHDIADPYFSAIAAGVTQVAADHDLIVSLGSTVRDFERERAFVSMLAAQRARAVIIAGSRSSARAETKRLTEEIRAFTATGGRVAAIGQNLLGSDTVLPENRAGARALANALLELGHRRFAVLAGPRELLTARDRLLGFTDGLTAAGISDARVVSGPFTRDGGYEAAAGLVAEGLDATCVFAVNDVMAVGALAAFRERGVDVPSDVSVAGFDDIMTLRDVLPALTTVRLPLTEMGVRAAELALDQDRPERPRVVRISGEVVLRASTAARKR